MNLTLMERFADPGLIDGLTAGEKLAGALITTCMGMGITFVVLAFIWACIAVMTRIFGSIDKRTAASVAGAGILLAQEAGTTGIITGGQESQAIAGAIAEPGINAEVIAVITAAIAASQGPCGRDTFVVRKIRRVSGDRPAWGSAGLTDSIESRRF